MVHVSKAVGMVVLWIFRTAGDLPNAVSHMAQIGEVRSCLRIGADGPSIFSAWSDD